MALEKHFCSLQPQGLGCSNGLEKILILRGIILPTASFTYFILQGQCSPLHCWCGRGAIWTVARLQPVSGADPGLLHLQQPSPGGGRGGRGRRLRGQDDRVLGL